jgi:hypothetical protein
MRKTAKAHVRCAPYAKAVVIALNALRWPLRGLYTSTIRGGFWPLLALGG